MRKTRFLILTVLLLALVAPTALSQDMMYNESPVLADLVAAGELPPVEERVPLEPQVTTPFKETGSYGGEMRFGFTGG